LKSVLSVTGRKRQKILIFHNNCCIYV